MVMASSARASLLSPPSSPLPPLQSPWPPQPDVDKMFFTSGGSGSSPSNSSGANRGASLREIDDEEATAVSEDGGRGKLYVAIGKDLKDGRSVMSLSRVGCNHIKSHRIHRELGNEKGRT